MLKKTVVAIFSFFILTAACQRSLAQNSKWPKTLLWQITGNGLQKPSYLFGTMHLQDKRIFNLGDSLYYYFGKADGFAIEIDFNEYIDSVLVQVFREKEEEELNGGDGKREGTKIDVIADSTKAIVDSVIAASGGTSSARIKGPSKKILRKLREERIRRLLKYGEMPTILDAYLYGLAMRQGKWLGAVEDVKDQLNLRDEMGKEIDEEDEAMQTDDKLRLTLEKMIGIYLDQDLNQIETYSLNYGSAVLKKILFNNRNIKMARSVDSLSRLRSMFYAVGAAHLPGDSGVIKLLRSKGFTVTPVFSNQKTAAEKYAANLSAIAWKRIEQEEKLYSIEMPGTPTNHNMFGEFVKMKVYVDITTFSVYMMGHTLAQYEDHELEATLKQMAKEMSNGYARLENFKKLNRGAMPGAEGITFGNGYYYRVQLFKKNNTSFILMLGTRKRPNLLTADADRYFNSFKAGELPAAAGTAGWKQFGLKEKAFTVMMPAVPKRNNAFEKQAEGSNWDFTVYDYTDLTGGFYYICQVRDIRAGYFLDGDSAYFDSFKENIKESAEEVVKEEMTIHQGFPAYRFDALSKEEGIFYKTMNVVRGNRVYTLIVLGSINKKNESGPEEYFKSLQLTEYSFPQWKIQEAEDKSFFTWGSSNYSIKKKEKEEEEDDDSTRIHYISYNVHDATSYEVLRDVLPPLFWVTDDSTFFKQRAYSYKGFTDSVLKYERVNNGNLKGAEILVQSANNNNLKKIRLLLHGDTLITLLTFIPTQYINNPDHNKFFSEFRMKNDKLRTSIFTNKADKLLKALQSKDSATFAEASSVLSLITFAKKDLPHLHDALLRPFPDDSLAYYSTRTRLVNALADISDSSTVDFIRANYHSLGGDKEKIKMSLLDALADYKTAYSYTALKDLLINHPPKELKENDRLSYRITDSLQLAVALYPELLSLLKNPLYWTSVADFTAKLVDSSIINIEMVRSFEKDLLYSADTLLNGILQKEEFYSWEYLDLFHLLGKLNSTAGNAILQRAVRAEDKELKQEVILRLLENNQPVNAAEIEKLAAEKEYRTDFYEKLKKLNRQSFFPAKYLTQKSFAESKAFMLGNDDYTPGEVEYLSQREVVFGGKKQRIYLFRIGYSEEEAGEKSSYLAIVGPYALDAKNLETSSDASDIHWDEEFDKKKINIHFDSLLKKGEEYLKKKQNLKE
jgi:uncharacterized protein YbaP (TraB family)